MCWVSSSAPVSGGAMGCFLSCFRGGSDPAVDLRVSESTRDLSIPRASRVFSVRFRCRWWRWWYVIPILLACLLSAGSARTGEPARGRVPERREKYGYGSCFRCANFLLFQSNFRYDAEFLIVGFGNISLEIEGSGRRDVEAVNGGGVDEELLREVPTTYLGSSVFLTVWKYIRIQSLLETSSGET